MQSPLLNILRRLEAQNVWRVGYQAVPQQGFTAATFSSSDEQRDASFGARGAGALVEASSAAVGEWYEDSSVSAQEALKLLVEHIRRSGPVSELS